MRALQDKKCKKSPFSIFFLCGMWGEGVKFLTGKFGQIKSGTYFCRPKIKQYAFFRPLLTDGVTGNTSDFGSEESRFEP
jgi:hypothetical protein